MRTHHPAAVHRHRVAAAALLVLALLLGGCAGGETGRVRVYAASSLGPVLEELAASSPIPFDVSLAGSQVLESQVRAGAPPGLLLLADPERAAALAADGLAGEPTAVAGNRLAVLVRPGADVTDLAALADPSLTVVLADGGVPLGDYTRAALVRLEEDGTLASGVAEAIVAGADSLEDSAASVVAKVTAGEADAAIVYATDAARADGLDALSVPGSDVAAYTGQVVGDATQAAELLAWLTDDEARRVWEAAGFVVDG